MLLLIVTAYDDAINSNSIMNVTINSNSMRILLIVTYYKPDDTINSNT